jgi:aminoacylase
VVQRALREGEEARGGEGGVDADCGWLVRLVDDVRAAGDKRKRTQTEPGEEGGEMAPEAEAPPLVAAEETTTLSGHVPCGCPVHVTVQTIRVNGMPAHVTKITAGGKREKEEERALCLYSHADVVPVAGADWKIDPFDEPVADGAHLAAAGAHVPATSAWSPTAATAAKTTSWRASQDVISLDADLAAALASPSSTPPGWVCGRGIQDMKCVTVQHIVSIYLYLTTAHAGPCSGEREGDREGERRLFSTRPLVLLVFPNEEIGGQRGMADFVHSPDFRSLNLGLVLDEGLAAERDDEYTVFYGERAIWWVAVRVTGPVGHGSRLVPDTATEQLHRIVGRFLDRRRQSEKALAAGVELGDLVSLNLTGLRAGVEGSWNVIPGEAEAIFDIRIPPSVPLDTFAAELHSFVAAESGGKLDFLVRTDVNVPSPTTGTVWTTLLDTVRESGRTPVARIFTAATDSRFLRNVARLPAYGFSPMANTPILLHDVDERLSIAELLRGVLVMGAVVKRLLEVDIPADEQVVA